MPVAQGEHAATDVAPVDVPKVPGRQAVQLCGFAEFDHDPAAQGVQVAAEPAPTAVDLVPGGQLVHWLSAPAPTVGP